uniref:GPAT/DHAPAT C-terminal domain-containing protein n=1 Tax=Timema tahoe TaxID=61484 RepID=A0A7R9IJG7_9NEOP|nr:unnamed protein product [Timema tahoe]
MVPMLKDCTRAQAIMSTNAVAFLLLTKFRKGTTLDVLAEALDQLRQELDWADRDLGFTGESVDVINHAVDLLGPGLIKRERHSEGAMITPVTMLPNVIELSYYSNALLSQYVIDAVLVTSIYSIFFEGLNGSLPSTNETVSIGQDKLVEYSLELFDILQFEFIFSKPCQYLDSLVMEAIENLKVKEILLEPEENTLNDEEQWSKRFAKHLEHEFDHSDDDDEPYFRVPHYQVDTSSKSMSYLALSELVDSCIIIMFQVDTSSKSMSYLALSELVDSCIIVMFQVDTSSKSMSYLALSELVDSCIIVMFQVDTSSKSMSHLALSELVDSGIIVMFQVDTSSKSMSHLEFLHTLLRSLLDVYVVSALVITRLVDRELPERDLVMEVLAEMKTQLDDGDMLYGESLCVDPIKNALKLFERWEILGCRSEDRIKLYHLKEAFDSETEVALVLDKLNRFKFPLNK